MRKIVLGITIFILIMSFIVYEKLTKIKDDNYLKTLEVHVEDVINGSGDTKIGEYAYVNAKKAKFEELEDKYFVEFSKDVVEGSGYNWVVIKFEDGTGIFYTGSSIELISYCEIDSETDMCGKSFGYYSIKGDKVIYKEN